MFDDLRKVPHLPINKRNISKITKFRKTRFRIKVLINSNIPFLFGLFYFANIVRRYEKIYKDQYHEEKHNKIIL